MDWQKNRVWIGLVALVVLGAGAFLAMRANRGDSPRDESRVPTNFPDLERDAIHALEITRPEDESPIRLERREGTWRLVQPLDVAADQSAVTTALDKLAELEVAGIASSNPEFHERLEVDSERGVRVVARGENGDALADLWIGAFRSGNTMVRVEGQEQVVSVRGSIKFAFNKELRDWRNRSMLDLEADSVREVAWTGPNGSFRFNRPEVAAEAPAEGEAAEGETPPATPATTLGDWAIAEVSFVPATPDGGVPARAASTTIEGFQPSKVRSMVASLARMRASDFAASEITADAAGITDASPRVTLTTADGAHTIRLGNEVDAETHNFYAMREGEPTVFVISRFLSERVHPTSVAFTAAAAPAAPPSEGADPHAGMPGMPGGGELPPEIMEQLRRQMAAQGMGGGAPPPPPPPH
jgi:hypothetical protein